ncbi:MAG: hypothetical protein IKU17_09330 [Clostridia bacterium]|nr:hypothetical protein [Clostridia bacterium]
MNYRYIPDQILGRCGNGQKPQPAEEPAEKYPCPCCGCITLPVPAENALAFICPVCLWEVDTFIRGEQEPSDQNHGLTLEQAKENYRACGAVLPQLKPHCRPLKPEELAKEDI